MKDTYKKIYHCVKKIPPGRVSTYNKVAEQAGFPGQARLVGYALHKLPENSGVPWHRVINSKGNISLPSGYDKLQKKILLSENIEISKQGKINLDKYCWY